MTHLSKQEKLDLIELYKRQHSMAKNDIERQRIAKYISLLTEDLEN